MSKEVKVKVVSTLPRSVTVDGVSIGSSVLCRCTEGKVYDATLYEAGEPLPQGYTVPAPAVFFTNDKGEPCDTFLVGPELELVEV